MGKEGKSSSQLALTLHHRTRGFFFRGMAVFFCLIWLTGCGDFASIFNKGRSSRRPTSKHEKGKQTASTKKRGAKGRVLAGFFIWPVDGEITSGFGERNGRPHDGIDIRAEKGTPVHAAADGEVAYAGKLGGYGNLVLLQHRNNYFTAYAHNSQIVVKEGRKVEQGDVISKVGSTGHSTGNHLHFEIRHQSTPMDPIAFLPSSSEPKTLIGRRDTFQEDVMARRPPVEKREEKNEEKNEVKSEAKSEEPLPFAYDL